MTSCSLVANGLASQVSGQVPTFSYRRTGHAGDFFGIQMTYMNGASTCYDGHPLFTPVIQNPAKKFSADCHFSVRGAYSGIFCPDVPVTNVPDGVLTVSFKDWIYHQPTPIPFPAIFGPSPAPKTVTAIASTLATSTTTKTSTFSTGYASTATTYIVGPTQTSTNTVTVTFTETSTNTNYVSSCKEPSPIPSSGKSSSSKSSTTTAAAEVSTTSVLTGALSTSTTLTSTTDATKSPPAGMSSNTATTTSTAPVATSTGVCPGSDGRTIDTSAGTFIVECGIDRSGNDMKNSPVYPGSYEGCIAACAERTGCVSVSYVINGPCYLKSSAGTATNNANIIGGRLISGSPSPSAVSTSTSTEPEASTPAQTVTVTTTIDGADYQCTCTPANVGFETTSSAAATASATPGATLDCPYSDGSTFTSDCGATYAIECYSDRYGSDIPGGISYVGTLEGCIADCDNTKDCVDVSYSPGASGPCYKKSSISTIRNDKGIFGARRLTGCTASAKLKLHRKRVVHQHTEPKNIQKRLAYGPDFTHIRSTITETRTSTSTSVRTAILTTTIAKSGTVTETVYKGASTTATAVVTASSKVTRTYQVTVTTCPAATNLAFS